MYVTDRFAGIIKNILFVQRCLLLILPANTDTSFFSFCCTLNISNVAEPVYHMLTFFCRLFTLVPLKSRSGFLSEASHTMKS